MPLLLLALLALPLPARAAAPKAAPPPQKPVAAPEPRELSPADRRLLQDLDLLLDFELLEAWDPTEDLPIPVADPEREAGGGP